MEPVVLKNEEVLHVDREVTKTVHLTKIRKCKSYCHIVLIPLTPNDHYNDR